ncbi:MAG: ATP-binding cassette domain-containing protein [Deltaproteobacteria bacterium]|nr:ATP-binding cassette domain-containing protein [Deltaproteobacteria bacterium]
MIEVIDIHKNFGHQEVLKGTNLTIEDGGITTIIGGSGSGKTVLLKTMIALLLPDSGQILVDGTDITGLGEKPLNEVREKFGFLFQGAALLDSMTIFDNVAFPLRERTRLGEDAIAGKVLERLDQVGLKDMGYKYPAEVSGGMKKRAGFARALVTDPEIVLFDEPTTGLDPLLGKSIHRLIADMQRRLGFTGVIVSHDIPEVFTISHRVAMLADGVIADHGPTGEFLESPNPAVQQFLKGETPDVA